MKVDVERGVPVTVPKKRPLVRCDSESIALKVRYLSWEKPSALIIKLVMKNKEDFEASFSMLNHQNVMGT